MKVTLMSAAIVLSAILVGCGAERRSSDSVQPTAASHGDSLPEPCDRGSYICWSPEEQLTGYRNIDKIFPTRRVDAGRAPSALPTEAYEITPAFSFDGQNWTVDTYMEAQNTVGLLVLKDGEIVLERYRQGYAQDQRWVSFSVAKSITSTLVGVALRDGFIRSLDDPLTQYLPELQASAYEGVTVGQLLTMTTGVDWNEDYDDPDADVWRIKSEQAEPGADPIVNYMAGLQRTSEPGTIFHYNTGETHLAGSLVRAASGKSLAAYLSESLWIPLAMERSATWMLDEGGQEQAGCCLSASLHDFARFGLFFLNGDTINGEFVVPEGWVDMATSASDVSRHSDEVAIYPQDGYGFMWWTHGDAFQAVGIFGQLIHANPTLGLVVVAQSAWEKATGGEDLEAHFLEAVEAAVSGESAVSD